jgi:hypothetical protein
MLRYSSSITIFIKEELTFIGRLNPSKILLTNTSCNNRLEHHTKTADHHTVRDDSVDMEGVDNNNYNPHGMFNYLLYEYYQILKDRNIKMDTKKEREVIFIHYHNYYHPYHVNYFYPLS